MRRYFVAALALALGACASAAQQDNVGFAAPDAQETTVSVQNNYWSDMAIYVVKTGGSRWRIGTVIGGTNAKLTIPNDLMVGSDVQLYADPIGPEAGFAFPRLALSPGSRLELRLEQNLAYSNFWIR